MAEKTYAGKIDNSGNQKVEAIYKPGTTKAPKMHEGGDLRVKKGKK